MNRQDVHLKAHEVAPVGLWSLRAGAPTVATVVSLNHPGLAPDTRTWCAASPAPPSSAW